MSKIKAIIPVFLAASIFLVGCGKTASDIPSEPVDSSTEVVVESSEEEFDPGAPSEEGSTSVPELSSMEDPTQAETSASSHLKDLKKQLESMTKDKYEGLVVESVIKERIATLPGMPINVSVKVTNNGDKTIRIAKGSSANVVPDALYVYSEGLQTVIPKEGLGPTTRDMAYVTLAPGKSEEYIYTLIAIKPTEGFDQYTRDLYNKDDGKYVTELSPDELKAGYPDMELVEPGSYKIAAILMYSDDVEDATGNPNAYAEHEFDITVNS